MPSPKVSAARELIESSICARGMVASNVETANYRRVWTRDSVVCGLAGGVTRSERIVDALATSLHNLASERGPNGEMPSSIDADGGQPPSYGGLAGRIDCGAWFAIGAAHFLHWCPSSPLRDSFRSVVTDSFRLYDCLELNNRGLLHSPLGGDWADDYCLHGYVLTANLLRIWALELCAQEFAVAEWAERARSLRTTVAENYWIGEDSDNCPHYHPAAYSLERKRPLLSYWRAAFSPAGYVRQFDGLGNSLALLVGLGNKVQTLATIQSIERICSETSIEMMPAFWPAITETDPQWPTLEAMAGHGFRNHPGKYHNGGLWPMVNGFGVAALELVGRRDLASDLGSALEATEAASFPEFFDGINGRPGGVTPCTWSAAGMLIADAAIEGRRLRGLHDAR